MRVRHRGITGDYSRFYPRACREHPKSTSYLTVEPGVRPLNLDVRQTIADLARDEGISDRYVSRVIRLAWLAPSVLERLVQRRELMVLSIFDLSGVAELPWVEQPELVFD